ncbi:hypothetical protein CGLO_16181 [Colletotrichum gloeosporioides Cg-14]|uniref:Uncharacterized protein n=1 Tax=Colletotrichum gloeosporioides (strain Cg-14) TaxID=1237896 RepID=T0L9X4_COLGC|nr:hypothetical protein CGLO_16181 [Colletotrichum gloeosporioides Cg-14]
MSQRNPNDEAPTANLPTTNAPTVQPLPTNVPRTKLPTSRVPTANVPTPNTPTTNSQHAGSLSADATPTGSKHIIDNSQDSPKRLRVSDNNNIGRGAPHQHPRQQPPQQPPRNPSHLNPNSWSLGLPFPGWRAPDVTPPNLTSVPQGSGSAGVVRPTYNPPTIEAATVTFSFQIKRKIGTMGIDNGAFSRTIAHLEDEFPGADVRFSVEKS